MKQIQELLDALEANIGLAPGFYTRLKDEQPSDWAFVIQLQVLVEAALTHVIVKTLADERVFDHISRLGFMGRGGKVELAMSLGAIDRESKAVCELLARIRNGFAHNLEHVGQTLQDYGDALPLDVKIDMLRKLAFLEAAEEQAVRLEGAPRFGRELRWNLWLAVGFVLLNLRTSDQRAELRAVRLESQKLTHDLWLSVNNPLIAIANYTGIGNLIGTSPAAATDPPTTA
ncbi:MAG: hypothetical protein ABJD97_08055 [Betaproteobacteria bacterium]